MTYIRRGVAALALFAVAGAASAVTVAAISPAPVFIGVLNANTSYLVTGTGVISIATGTDLNFKPDGVPANTINTPGFGNFNPSGDDHVNNIPNPGPNYGVAGPGTNFGSLIGTFTATPTGMADYFKIGNSTTIAAAGASRTLYALVNDDFYPNNGGSFEVTATVSAVPEPAQAVLLLAGLGVVGMVGRRRTRKD